MKFCPNFLSTALGSFPNEELNDLARNIYKTLDIPLWPQLPNRNFRESMYIQFSSPLPSIKIDTKNEKVYFDTNVDLSQNLQLFYERYLSEDINYFKLPEDFAEGFYSLQKDLLAVETEIRDERKKEKDRSWIKGQVTGPVSFGLTVSDQDLKASLYNDFLQDCIIKNISMNARWQIRELRKISPSVMIFVDEPYMAAFGSAYVNISRERVVRMLNEVFEAIHIEGAIAGVHCCANTDWSVLLETNVDILSIDANGYMQNLFLFYERLLSFLGRGGVIAWGIVPNDNEIYEVSNDEIADKLLKGLEGFQQNVFSKGVEISIKDIANQSLVTPVCGLGSSTVEISEQVLKMLPLVTENLRNKVMERKN